ISAQQVADAALPRQSPAEEVAVGLGRILERTGIAVHDVEEVAGGGQLFRIDRYGIALQVPVRRPAGAAVLYGEWETAGPAIDAGELPITDDGIRPARQAGYELIPAYGQIPHPVQVDLVTNVEIGDLVALPGIPGVNQESGVATVVERGEEAAALHRRCRVAGLRECVVQVELQTVRVPLPQAHLHGMVFRNSQAADRAQRIELPVEVRELPQDTARREAELVGVVQGRSEVTAIAAAIELANHLHGGCAAGTAETSRVREQILPVRNWRDRGIRADAGACRNPRCGSSRQRSLHCAEVVHARLGINQVQGHCQ